MMRQRRRAPGLGIFLLGYQMFRMGFEHIPPVTLTTVGIHVAVFLRLLDIYWPSNSEVCISAFNVWYRHEWQRLIFAAFYHINDWHLYFNMISFLWKGRSLERKFGSEYFAYLLAVFTLLTNCALVGLGLLAERVLGEPHYLTDCAIGFSGVVFALKVVTTYMLPPGVEYIMNIIPVPTRYACWAELVLIQIMVPNTSFMGHLAGILVGLAYAKGPLKYMMDLPFTPTRRSTGPGYMNYSGTASNWWQREPAQNYRYNTRQGSHRGQGQTYRGEYQPEQPRQDTHTYSAGLGLSEEEQLQRAMLNSLHDRTQPSAPPLHPDDNDMRMDGTSSRLYPDLDTQTHHENRGGLDEMRARRLERFSRH